MESFQELGLPEFLGKSLQQMNFTQPTPVQAQAIPAALQGRDVVASAQTGTGKTAAFGIPLLTFLSKHPDQGALVMAPTRELAAQVLEVLRKLSGSHPLGGSVLLIGGANMGGQINALLGKPRLIIGTPGRIIDHLNRGSLNLSKAGFLVLDEADRMLDMGFEPQLEEIRKRLPTERQTLLFSATFPPDIQALGARYLKSPLRITVEGGGRPVEKINQMILRTTEPRKFEELAAELKERQGSVVVFARTQHRVERLLGKFKDAGFKATQVHGGRTQSQRRQALEQFRQGSYRILVATDVAARGLDIHHIAHVVNYDLPRNPEDYIHRVGRTARAGAQGDSLSLVTPEDRPLWESILRLIQVPRDSIQVVPSRFAAPGPEPS
ncbi:MAG TPA: DEAD/DEAH box helicase, partial [bacterium]|nr:DEAD/DEAH box helicase [bacterium]